MSDPILVPVTGRVNDITGQTFEKLTVIGYAGRRGAAHYWWCQCSCGSDPKQFARTAIGRVKSCGCAWSDAGIRSRSHLDGKRFGRLLVVCRDSKSTNRQTVWACKCDCGNEVLVSHGSLTTGNSKSCGCLRADTVRAMRLSHGHRTGRRRSPEYTVWQCIKERCYNPRNKRYGDYGGRGISVCKRWLDSFEHFLSDIGPRPSSEHSIERRDNSGNYDPENCVWATRRQQGRNKRNNIRLKLDGETHTLVEWGEIKGIPYSTLHYRVRKGWNDLRVLSQPVKER